MRYKLETMCGDTFSEVAKEAKRIAIEKAVIVDFDFNGIHCKVNATTNLINLNRDYTNAFTMEWKTIGPICVDEYSPKIQQDLASKIQLQEKEYKISEAKYKREQEEAIKSLTEKLEDGDFIQLREDQIEAWNKIVDVNVDPYGKAGVDYARNWAILMQIEISKGKTIIECAEATSHEADVDGITGFMYGMAVSILSKVWVHGEELRKWHNKDYGHEGDGVVNPAVLTISKKED